MGTRRTFLAALILALLGARQATAETRDYEDFFQKFFGDLAQELRTAERERKSGILLVYEQEDCPFCERLHNSILRSRAVQEFYRRHFLVFRVDIRGDTSVVTFEGTSMSEKAFAFRNRVRATPACVFYGLDGKESARFTGVPKDEHEFLLLGQYVQEGAYRTQPFVKYKAGR